MELTAEKIIAANNFFRFANIKAINIEDMNVCHISETYIYFYIVARVENGYEIIKIGKNSGNFHDVIDGEEFVECEEWDEVESILGELGQI